MPKNIDKDEMKFYNNVVEEFDLPVLEPNPTKALQQYSIKNVYNEQCNAVYDTISQNYLEYCHVIKTEARPL